MKTSKLLLLLACCGVVAIVVLVAARESASRDPVDPLAAWREARVQPATPHTDRHTVHPYFNITPESPDGRWLLFYTSTAEDGQEGELRIIERATGREKVIARNVVVEDIHRVACQQWVSNGRRVAFHDYRDGEWVVAAVDINTLEERVLARGRQIGWGQPDSDIVPLYGPHWDPEAHRDMDLLNVKTGELQTVLTAREVREAYPDWVEKEFGDRPISIFFPILSPDLKRAMIKLATPAGGHFRSREASIRKLLIVYDLERSKFLFVHEHWGHPAWHPDSRTIINVPNVLIDSDNGETRPIPELPRFPGSHPSISPDGRLFATDTRLDPFGGSREEGGVVVADLRGGAYEIQHRFENTRGASSWRPSHSHPAFSPGGRRVYYNINSTQWTQLYVAEKTD